jgi:polar amino acid transport system substrate-binding protein
VTSTRFIRAAAMTLAALGLVSLAACSSSSTESPESESAAAAPAAASSAAAEDLGVATPGVITIGTITDAKPYAYSENGELTGFEIDLIKAAAERAGLTPELTTMDFSALLAAVNNGQFDVVASAVGITDERKELVDFSNGYLAGYFALLTKDGKVTDLPSIEGKKIGVLQGSIQDTNSATLIPGAEVVRFPDTNSATQALKTDRVEGIFIDYETALAETKKDAALTVAFTEPATDFPAGWAVKKGNAALLTTLNAALDELVADGTWMTLYTKYFPEAPVPTDAEQPPYVK